MGSILLIRLNFAHLCIYFAYCTIAMQRTVLPMGILSISHKTYINKLSLTELNTSLIQNTYVTHECAYNVAQKHILTVLQIKLDFC